jgi:hypothetical protein
MAGMVIRVRWKSDHIKQTQPFLGVFIVLISSNRFRLFCCRTLSAFGELSGAHLVILAGLQPAARSLVLY